MERVVVARGEAARAVDLAGVPGARADVPDPARLLPRVPERAGGGGGVQGVRQGQQRRHLARGDQDDAAQGVQGAPLFVAEHARCRPGADDARQRAAAHCADHSVLHLVERVWCEYRELAHESVHDRDWCEFYFQELGEQCVRCDHVPLCHSVSLRGVRVCDVLLVMTCAL